MKNFLFTYYLIITFISIKVDLMSENTSEFYEARKIADKSKIIHCRIHGTIRLSPNIVSLVDTPEFQRLRHISQLGLCHYVYPSATHTRFEHSIGVSYLAGNMITYIKDTYPNRKFIIKEIQSEPMLIDDLIVECYKIAGLCHDIGHGPYSHLFDDVLMGKSNHPYATHEARSCWITETICKRVLGNILTDAHINFIKSLIRPGPQHEGALYQIVANYYTGLDVDKFDYLLRDTYCLNKKISFDYQRLITDFIIDENGNIAYPKQSSLEPYLCYSSRYYMHKSVYNHKTVKIYEEMLTDIFRLVDPIFKISDSVNDMDKFCKFVDSTISNRLELYATNSDWIQWNLTPEQHADLKKACEIHRRIVTRQLYKCTISLVDLQPGQDSSDIRFSDCPDLVKKNSSLATALDKALDLLIKSAPEFKREDFIIHKTKLSLMKIHNLYERVPFYYKKEDPRSFTKSEKQISCLLSGQEATEILWYLICRSETEKELVEIMTKILLENNLIDHANIIV
jgi:HD superfamily phosphohydrolase